MPRHHLLAPALLLFACTDRPAVETADSTASTTGESTSAAPTSDPPTGTTTPATDTAPTDTVVTDTSATDTGTTEAITSDTGTTGPGTTATTTTATTGTDTTDGTTTGLTATDTGSSSTGDPPAPGCHPCDDFVVLDGPIDIDPTTDITQFGCLEGVKGHMSVAGDLTVEQLAPLCHLRSVSQSLSIKKNAVLTDLTPFASLEDVGVLQLWELPALTAISGMTSFKEAMQIEIDTTGATTLGSFAPDFLGIRTLRLWSNPALTDLSKMVEWGLDGEFQSIEIRDSTALTDISTLTDLIALGGPNFFFELDNLPALKSLAGLGAAKSGHYTLQNLPLITDLKPLATVKTLTSLHLRALPLTSLTGLDSLTTARLTIDTMPALTSLNGLQSFQSGDLFLLDLPVLTSLTALTGFTTGDFVTLYNLPLVPSLTGLDKLTTVNSLMIGDCVNGGNNGMNGMTGITDLTGLGSLTSAKEFMVTNSPKLTSLKGAGKLSVVSERLAIINNPKLPKPAFDAFLVQVAEPMMMTCFGDWNACGCIEIMPP